ncbi:putative transposase (plasmid) [Rhodococcus erythropolis PR4]|uniref:Putative transposase n=1 Tax=Rhodococcus erythropolis (strain PR4 / NBRC 100887) TaxID=234621 RepID=Q3L9G3_RHOE4|nr:putative transposase [Rhodococcus erythropolis PR4]
MRHKWPPAGSLRWPSTISRIRLDPKTQVYVEKKISEGHSKLEAIRCLKRYLAREIYYLLNPGQQTITPNTRQHRKAA